MSFGDYRASIAVGGWRRRQELGGIGGQKFSSAELTVGSVPSTRYVQPFAWDYAKYPNRGPLRELVSLISSGLVAIDEELKQLASSYGDKSAVLPDAKRKRGRI